MRWVEHRQGAHFLGMRSCVKSSQFLCDTVPILQMSGLRLQEVKVLAQGHKAKWHSYGAVAPGPSGLTYPPRSGQPLSTGKWAESMATGLWEGWCHGERQNTAFRTGRSGDPWVAQGFSACLWPRADPGDQGSSPTSGSLHGACFSLCLCLCLSLSLSFCVSHE